jgi:hypothetical protein
MGWLDRLLGKPKKDPNADPVGPIGGDERPASPTQAAPYISPGDPGGTYAPHPHFIPSIESQQSLRNYEGLPTSPMVGDYPQQVLWPTEVVRYPHADRAPRRSPGADPRWDPVPNEALDARTIYSHNRPWNLAPRLDGNRTTFSLSDVMIPHSDGVSGVRKAPRATMFVEPAPWGTNVVDTSAASGTPFVAGDVSTPSAVRVSTADLPFTGRGTYRLG